MVKQINAPSSAQSTQGHSVQRMEKSEEEEELQKKPGITAIQRIKEPEEEELQAKPIISPIQRSLLFPVVQRMEEPEEEDLQTKPNLQRGEALAGGEASADLQQFSFWRSGREREAIALWNWR